MKKKFSSMGRVAIALVLALSLVLVMGVPVSAAGALTGVTATPADSTETATTTYTIGFTTATPGNVKYVDMVFDAAFDVSSVGGTAIVTGIGAGTVSDAGQTVTYTVTDPALIPAGTVITIALSGIVNPVAGDYSPAVTITTKTAAPGDIDAGIADVTITAAPASFQVVTSDTVTVGETFSVTITAKDGAGGAGDPVTGYTGDHYIQFTSAGDITGPAFEVINFAEGEGISTSSFISPTVDETGTDDITAETLTPEVVVSGKSDPIIVNPAAFAGFTIAVPGSAEAGAALGNITVTAVDANSLTVTDYTGTVYFESTDAEAVLPYTSSDRYTFTTEDSGLKVFTTGFTLKTVDEEGQTITVTDGTVSKTSSAITVTPATASEITVTAAPTSIRADTINASTITATAYDAFGNVATGYDINATITSSLGTISDDTEFASGVATATLQSTYVGTVGTATIKVLPDSGTVPYATTTVSLVAALTAEVWVDKTDGLDSNPGTEAFPVQTIDKGIEIAGEGDTVNVLPGTYAPSATISIPNTKDGLTLKSTDGAAVTIIDATGITPAADPTVKILDGADDVTVEGFTIKDSPGSGIWIMYNTEGAIVQNNIFSVGGKIAICLPYDPGRHPVPAVVAGATVSGNIIEGCTGGISLEGGVKNSTISDNTITGCTDTSGQAIALKGGDDAARKTQGNTISGNTITNGAGYGISLHTHWAGGSLLDDNLIEANTISLNAKAGIKVDSGLTVTELVITGNDITDNTGDGIEIGTSWASSNAINNNNIYGNGSTADYNICSATDIFVDAENNWWGTAIESGIKVTLSGNIDYSPWLDAVYSAPVAPVTTIDLVVSWNLISLPLYIPSENRAPVDLLAGVLTGVEIVWGNYTPATGDFESYIPGEEGNDLTAMRDGKGYWVSMDAADTLDITILGTELPEAPYAPPTYDVVEGWNLIGFKSTTAKAAETYLAAIDGDYTMIYGFADGAYFAVQATDNLEPGYGYWIAVTVLGTIYP